MVWTNKDAGNENMFGHDDDNDEDDDEGIWEAGGRGRRQLSLYKQAAPGGKPTLPAFYHDHHDHDHDHDDFCEDYIKDDVGIMRIFQRR